MNSMTSVWLGIIFGTADDGGRGVRLRLRFSEEEEEDEKSFSFHEIIPLIVQCDCHLKREECQKDGLANSIFKNKVGGAVCAVTERSISQTFSNCLCMWSCE